MRPSLIALAAGVALLALPSAPAVAAAPPAPFPAVPEAPAIAEADVVEVLACGPRCGQNRRVSRRTARRTSRRHDHYRGGGYYGRPGVVVYDDRPNTAAVGLAAGIAGMAVGAAIANSAKDAPPPDDYPH